MVIDIILWLIIVGVITIFTSVIAGFCNTNKEFWKWVDLFWILFAIFSVSIAVQKYSSTEKEVRLTNSKLLIEKTERKMIQALERRRAKLQCDKLNQEDVLLQGITISTVDCNYLLDLLIIKLPDFFDESQTGGADLRRILINGEARSKKYGDSWYPWSEIAPNTLKSSPFDKDEGYLNSHVYDDEAMHKLHEFILDEEKVRQKEFEFIKVLSTKKTAFPIDPEVLHTLFYVLFPIFFALRVGKSFADIRSARKDKGSTESLCKKNENQESNKTSECSSGGEKDQVKNS